MQYNQAADKMEEIKTTIRTILNISDELVNEVVAKLEELGCTCLEDCLLVHEEDLSPPLKKIQCRKLVQAWKQSGECNLC